MTTNVWQFAFEQLRKTTFRRGSWAVGALVIGAVGAGALLGGTGLAGCEPPDYETCNTTFQVFVNNSPVPKNLQVMLCNSAGADSYCVDLHPSDGDGGVRQVNTALEGVSRWQSEDLGNYSKNDCKPGPFELEITADGCTKYTQHIGAFNKSSQVDVELDCSGTVTSAIPKTSTGGSCTRNQDCPTGAPTCDEQYKRCVACTKTDASRCEGATPLCDVSEGLCVECTRDADCSPRGEQWSCDLTNKACRAPGSSSGAAGLGDGGMADASARDAGPRDAGISDAEAVRCDGGDC